MKESPEQIMRELCENVAGGIPYIPEEYLI